MGLLNYLIEQKIGTIVPSTKTLWFQKTVLKKKRKTKRWIFWKREGLSQKMRERGWNQIEHKTKSSSQTNSLKKRICKRKNAGPNCKAKAIKL